MPMLHYWVSLIELSHVNQADIFTTVTARLMKHLAAMGTLYEEVEGVYSLTPLSKALSQAGEFQEAMPLR